MTSLKKLLIYIYALLALSLIFLSTSSLFEANQDFNNQFIYLKKQLIWIAVSSIAMYITANFPPKIIQKYSTLFYFFSVFLLFLPLIGGNQILGASRWINFGPVNLQPTEIFKLATILFFANNITKQTKFGQSLAYLLIPLVLIMLQPNLSSVLLIVAIFSGLYFIDNTNRANLALFLLLSLVGLVPAIILSPYRLKRLSQSYHSNQLVISFGSGSFFGKGIGNSTQKYKFLPQISTDSILAIVGEETGLIGFSLVILLFLLILLCLLKIASQTNHIYSQLVCLGLFYWIFFQATINIGVVIGLLPLTGVPLPFFSYGGSSLLSLMIGIGLVINSQHDQKTTNHR